MDGVQYGVQHQTIIVDDIKKPSDVAHAYDELVSARKLSRDSMIEVVIKASVKYPSLTKGYFGSRESLPKSICKIRFSCLYALCSDVSRIANCEIEIAADKLVLVGRSGSGISALNPRRKIQVSHISSDSVTICADDVLEVLRHVDMGMLRSVNLSSVCESESCMAEWIRVRDTIVQNGPADVDYKGPTFYGDSYEECDGLCDGDCYHCDFRDGVPDEEWSDDGAVEDGE